MPKSDLDWRDVPITLGTDGLYHGKMTVGHKANGTLDRRHRSGHTAKEVEVKLRKLVREIEAGVKPAVGAGRLTWRRGFTVWLTDIAPVGQRALRPRVLAGYKSICRNWIFPHLGELLIDETEPEQLDALYAKMRKAGRSDSTILHAHAVVRSGLATLLRRRKIRRNVGQLVNRPGRTRSRKTPLPLDVAQRVVRVAVQRRNGARWLVGLQVGPRQGEALGLCWPQVDLESDPATVEISWQLQRLTWAHGCADPHACGLTSGPKGAPVHRFARCRPATRGPRKGQCALHLGVKGCPPPCTRDCASHAARCPQRQGGGLVLMRPKTWDDEHPQPHVVALAPQVAVLLRQHREAQAAERRIAGNAWRRMRHPDGGEADFCFRQVDGAPIDPRRDWGEWQDILSVAGVDPTRVHALRHTAASMMVGLGVDLAIVQEVLTHAQIATTAGYTTVRAEVTAPAAGLMGDALFGGSVTDLVTERQRRRAS